MRRNHCYLTIWNRKYDLAIHLGTPACRMSVGSANFATKLIAMAMSFERSQKYERMMKPCHTLTDTENSVKIGLAYSRITGWDIWPLKRNITRNKEKRISTTYSPFCGQAERAKRAMWIWLCLLYNQKESGESRAPTWREWIRHGGEPWLRSVIGVNRALSQQTAATDRQTHRQSARVARRSCIQQLVGVGRNSFYCCTLLHQHCFTSQVGLWDRTLLLLFYINVKNRSLSPS